MSEKIEAPELTKAQLADVLARYAAGQPVKRIATETGAAYTAVYFHTVNGGKVDRQPLACRCGAENYSGGKCKPCYMRAWYARRRARVLMDARGRRDEPKF